MTATEGLEQAAQNLENAQAVVELAKGAPADVRKTAEAAHARAQVLFQMLLMRIMRGSVGER